MRTERDKYMPKNIFRSLCIKKLLFDAIFSISVTTTATAATKKNNIKKECMILIFVRTYIE